ncbi:hypothetical protein R6Q57_014185 [Mikania cordata]
MTRPYRFLSSVTNSSPEAVTESPDHVESDIAFILAALLCALVCVVGLIAVAHCAWLRRRSMVNQISDQPSSNKGIEKKFVDLLPKFAYETDAGEKPSSDDCDCVICLVEYANGDEIRLLPHCGHRFHVGCIDTWLHSHSSCPSCRQILVIKMCGEFPTIFAGKTSSEANHDDRQSTGHWWGVPGLYVV